MINKLKITIPRKRTTKKNYNSSDRFVLIATTCLAIALVSTMTPPAANAASIYRIVNNPAVQDGYTLSGTITTDGTTGTIYGSNVLAWSFLVSNGVDTYSASSSQPGSSVIVDGIVATSDYLALPLSTVSNPYDINLNGATSAVQWSGSTLQDGAFTSASQWNGSWPWWQDFITTTPHDVPGGWAIADNGTPVPIYLNPPTRLANGSVQFGFTNSSGILCSVFASTNPALPFSNWTLLGAATEMTPGQFQFTDTQATNNPRRFYRVRSP
jgi:hypothetical protein